MRNYSAKQTLAHWMDILQFQFNTPTITMNYTSACRLCAIKSVKLINHRSHSESISWGPTFGSADLNQVDHILMFEQLQDLDLSQSCDWELTKQPQETSLVTA